MSLELLKKKRTTLRSKSTKLVNYLTQSVIESLCKADLDVNLAKAEEYITKLIEIDGPIEEDNYNNCSDEEILKLEEVCDSYIDKLRRIISLIKASITLIQDQPTSHGVGNAFAVNRTKLHLPNINLPTFSADPNKDSMSCETFINTLEQLWSCYNLNSIEKYSLLERQTESRAKAMINALTLTNRSYDTAKNILLKAFAETVPQQFSIIKQMKSLQLKSRGGDPYLYYASFEKIIETMKEQKIDIDLVLQYFIWEGMPASMQDILITVTQKSFPSLTEIRSSFLAASSRYATHCGKTKNDDTEISMHAMSLKKSNEIQSKSIYNQNVQRKMYCCFCSSTSHKNSKCDKYITAQEKRDRIKVLNLCFRCLRPGHLIEVCTFKLNNSCFKCQRNHWNYLCLKTKTENDSPTMENNQLRKSKGQPDVTNNQ